MPLSSGDEIGDQVGTVDLDIMPGVRQQVQLAVGEQRRKVARDTRVEGAVASAEDDPDQRAEAAQVADPPSVGEHGADQVVVEAPERRLGRQELFVQLRY